ncbi:hybrid cluster protein [Photorhabdus temperata]|uniref:hybrid cluster protein n=1 Tax=Photorhabdus temperata TaxID=574560 RepID=UPI00038A15D3|nr:hybrid cluster protein [Photorhabdus temperata subsp. temperata M1021]
MVVLTRKVCGKTAETADLQDLLVAVLQGLSAWAITARELSKRNPWRVSLTASLSRKR